MLTKQHVPLDENVPVAERNMKHVKYAIHFLSEWCNAEFVLHIVHTL